MSLSRQSGRGELVPVEVVTDAVVCAACGKKVVVNWYEGRRKPHPKPRPWRDNGNAYSVSECPDLCDAGLVRVECRGYYTPRSEEC